MKTFELAEQRSTDVLLAHALKTTNQQYGSEDSRAFELCSIV